MEEELATAATGKFVFGVTVAPRDLMVLIELLNAMISGRLDVVVWMNVLGMPDQDETCFVVR